MNKVIRSRRFWLMLAAFVILGVGRLYAADEGLRARWTPGPGDGPIKDVSGNSADIYPGYQSPMHIPGRGDGFFDLDGLGDYGLFSANPKGLVDYPGLTVMVWAYPHQQLFAKRSILLAQDFFLDLGVEYGGRPSAQVYVNKGWQVAGAEKTVSFDRWNNLTVTYDQQYLTLYLDGVPAGKAEIKGALVPNQRSCFVGCSCSDENSYWCGLIGPMEIYSRALSPEEIAGRIKDTRPKDLPAGYKLKADKVEQPLVFNGGFERLTERGFSVAGGWRTNTWGENKAYFTEETQDVHGGKSCQKIEVTSFTDGGVVLCQRGAGPILKANTRYKMEVWLKGNESVGEVTVWLRDKSWKDAPASPAFAKNVPVTTEWKKYTIISEIKADIVGNVAIMVHPKQSGILWIDDLTLKPMTGE